MTKISKAFKEEFLLERKVDDNEKTNYIKDILVDADVLVALAKTNDTNHQKAIKFSDKLQKAGATYYFSPFTVAEAVTVLSYKISHQTAKDFLGEVRRLAIPILELPEKHKDMADNWFLKQNKKGTSYFDCYNMALLERYKEQLATIFSFDSVYKKNGFLTVENMKF